MRYVFKKQASDESQAHFRTRDPMFPARELFSQPAQWNPILASGLTEWLMTKRGIVMPLLRQRHDYCHLSFAGACPEVHAGTQLLGIWVNRLLGSTRTQICSNMYARAYKKLTSLSTCLIRHDSKYVSYVKILRHLIRKCLAFPLMFFLSNDATFTLSKVLFSKRYCSILFLPV